MWIQRQCPSDSRWERNFINVNEEVLPHEQNDFDAVCLENFRRRCVMR